MSVRSIWLVTTGEPLPVDGDGVRLLRHGLLARMLADQGWQVTWWTSAFDHTSKHHRVTGSAGICELAANYRIVLLPSSGYQRNVSLARFRDHAQIAQAFTDRTAEQTAPDVILCSYPTLELADAATRYGVAHQVPVVLDIRDLWPDIFLELAPRWLRPLARLALRRSFGRSVRSLRAASAVVGITRPIRDWGLVRAGRPAGALDSVFPLAYAEPMTVPGRQREADARWDALGLRPDTFVVCFFGALGRQFDFDTVLRAAEALQRQRPDVRFVICGTGQRLPELQAAARRLTNVLVPGWLDQSDIWALMQRSACGLAPYVNEYSFTISLPNKIIEYFAGGLPVVSCLQGESRVLVEKHAAGVHYTPHDNADLARTIANLAADRVQRLAMARRARALYEREFSASLVYGQMIELLTQVASKGDYTLSRQGLHE